MIDYKSNNSAIHNFTILAERHSGTNYLERLFTGSDCWKTKSEYHAFDIPITWDFGFKHWFGFESKKIYEHGNNTLFICLVRDPFDWITAMYNYKHHIPDTLSESLLQFLTNEWWSIGRGRRHGDEAGLLADQEIMADRNYITNERYKNIFEMRKYKIHYVLYTIPLICKNFVIVRYEDLLANNNEDFLSFISTTYGLKLISKPPINTYEPKNHKWVLDDEQPDVKEIISSNLDWSLENKCLYYQPPSP